MTKKTVLALFVSNAGSLQNGLLALLTTIPQVTPMLVGEEHSIAMRLVENHQPTLAIMDISMPGVVETIRQIKELCPQIHLIVLVNNVEGQKDAKELGVDRVLLKGFPAQKLVDVVEELIDQRGSTSPNQKNKEGGTHAN